MFRSSRSFTATTALLRVLVTHLKKLRTEILTPATAAYAISNSAVAAKPASTPYAPTSITETTTVPLRDGSHGTTPPNIAVRRI